MISKTPVSLLSASQIVNLESISIKIVYPWINIDRTSIQHRSDGKSDGFPRSACLWDRSGLGVWSPNRWSPLQSLSLCRSSNWWLLLRICHRTGNIPLPDFHDYPMEHVSWQALWTNIVVPCREGPFVYFRGKEHNQKWNLRTPALEMSVSELTLKNSVSFSFNPNLKIYGANHKSLQKTASVISKTSGEYDNFWVRKPCTRSYTHLSHARLTTPTVWWMG